MNDDLRLLEYMFSNKSNGDGWLTLFHCPETVLAC